MRTIAAPIEQADQVALFEALRKSLGDLVAAKTRFESADLAVTASSVEKAPYRLDSTYAVEAKVEKFSINGSFRPQTGDRKSNGPWVAAADDAAELRLAVWRELLAVIQKGEVPWSAVGIGISRVADHRHWELSSHIDCAGRGKTSCLHCYGDGRITCERCIGSGEMNCDNYSCIGGTQTCPRCSGTCQISQSVSVTAYDANGNPYTEYRIVYSPCDNYVSCRAGRVQCNRCHGRMRVRCTACGASGKITCGVCSGSGSIRCNPCGGTGSTGEVAQGHAEIDIAHQIVIPEEGCPELVKIAQRLGSASSLALVSHVSAVTHLEAGNSVEPTTARIQRHAETDIYRMSIECEGMEFHVVAYGNEARLWTVGGIVEHLVADDLKSLEESIAAARKEGWLSRNRKTVAEPLKNVIASEINSDVLNPKNQAESQSSYPGAVSPDYIEKLQQAVRSALNLMVIRNAKDVSLNACVAVLVIAMLVWAVYGELMGWVVGLALIGVAELVRQILLKREVRRITHTNEGRELLQSLTSTGWASRGAKALVALPAVLLLWAAMAVVPSERPWADAKDAQEKALVPDLEKMDSGGDSEVGGDE